MSTPHEARINRLIDELGEFATTAVVLLEMPPSEGTASGSPFIFEVRGSQFAAEGLAQDFLHRRRDRDLAERIAETFDQKDE